MTKWTEDLTNTLRDAVGDAGAEVSREQVQEIADRMEISNRSVSSKLRKEGYTVETVAASPKSYTDDETEQLRSLLENNSGQFTYAELAEQLGTDHGARSVQGKVLSMELTDHVRATPPKEVERTYTDAETDQVVQLINAGKFLEEIAEAVGKETNSVRGKALSLLKAGTITALPAQRDRKIAAKDVFEELGDNLSNMTVEEIVAQTGKTARGVKTVLSRRKLTAKDYDGNKKAAKAAKAAEAA